MDPGFSERTFEFCYNAEYCQINAAVLATHPHIPSQRQEKDLGYDVEFQIRQGKFTKSVFLQHKVSHHGEVRAGRNAQFYDPYRGPYFRFSIDNEQHNTLCELSRTKGNAFYCAPRFNLRHELEAHFRAPSIAQNSILLDPLDVGEINDNDRHNITYAPDGSNPLLHSELRRFRKSFGGGRDDSPVLKKTVINQGYIEELSEELVHRTLDSRHRRIAVEALKLPKPIEQVQIILGHVYDVSWFLVP